MATTTSAQYREIMREIKYRTEFIGALNRNPQLAIYNWTWIESICLQIRMILENIALACLVANGDQLDKLPKRIEKEYHAEAIFSRLAKVNPNCYPQPVVLAPSPTPASLSNVPADRYRGQLVDRPGNDWLTRDEFKTIYGRIGQVLHARNPLGTKVEYDYYRKAALTWHGRIMHLLSHHKVTVPDDKMMYIVLMQAVGAAPGHAKGDVQVAEFQKWNGAQLTSQGPEN